eukprot:11848438-Alexandrium_andersonii.AAC.1
MCPCPAWPLAAVRLPRSRDQKAVCGVRRHACKVSMLMLGKGVQMQLWTDKRGVHSCVLR